MAKIIQEHQLKRLVMTAFVNTQVYPFIVIASWRVIVGGRITSNI